MQMAGSVEVSIAAWSRNVILKLFSRTLENDVTKKSLFHTFHQAFYKNFVILVFWNKDSPFGPISIMTDWKLGPIWGILYFYLMRNFTANLPRFWKFVKDYVKNKIQNLA